MRVSAEVARVLITAHAGCLGTEANSRESFEAAFASRADIIEADVRGTLDGVPVLTHDDTIKTRNGRATKLAKLTWDEIAASGEAGIMRLEMFFELCAELDSGIRGGGRTVLNLDIKDASILPEVGNAVRFRGRRDSVLFSGLYEADLTAARAEIPDLRYLFNADALVGAGGGTAGEAERVCDIIRRKGCAGINLEWTRASAEFLDAARSRGVPTMLWTVDKREDMLSALALKPDSITTNRPDLLAGILIRS